MEWVDFREQKPEKMIMALVFNEKGWMTVIRATYHPKQEAWLLYDPHYREPVLLEVTHYLEIPTQPPLI
jgi:hypothetical protein